VVITTIATVSASRIWRQAIFSHAGGANYFAGGAIGCSVMPGGEGEPHPYAARRSQSTHGAEREMEIRVVHVAKVESRLRIEWHLRQRSHR
jgi:hypothetical protein